jgi:hypothetical protein
VDLEGYTLSRAGWIYQAMGFLGFILNGSTVVQTKKNPVEVKSPRLKKRQIVLAFRSESVLNMPLVM